MFIKKVFYYEVTQAFKTSTMMGTKTRLLLGLIFDQYH